MGLPLHPSFIRYFSMENRYKNILVIVSGLLVFYYIFRLEALILAATTIGVLASLLPFFAKYLEKLWLKLALLLGWINSKILLSIVFYVFVLPLAIISRLFTKDPLKLKKQKSTVYIDRDHLYTKQDLENLW